MGDTDVGGVVRRRVQLLTFLWMEKGPPLGSAQSPGGKSDLRLLLLLQHAGRLTLLRVARPASPTRETRDAIDPF